MRMRRLEKGGESVEAVGEERILLPVVGEGRWSFLEVLPGDILGGASLRKEEGKLRKREKQRRRGAQEFSRSFRLERNFTSM